MSQSRRLNSVEMACKYPFSLILDVSLDMTILPCCSPSSAIYVPDERLRQGGWWTNTTTYKKSRFPGCTRSSNDGRLSLWKPNCYITMLVGLQQRSRVTGGGFTTLGAAVSTSSLEDVGYGMSLDALGLSTPIFVLPCSFCFSTSTTSFHLRVASSSPNLPRLLRQGGGPLPSSPSAKKLRGP
jgi:hypothetical protein